MLSRRQFAALLGASMIARTAKAAEDAAASPGGAALAFAPPRPFPSRRSPRRARAMTAEPYRPRPDPAPGVLTRIGYEQHLAIRQPVAGGLFAGEGPDGIVTAFHLGEIFRHPVRLHVVEDGQARELLYRNDYFAYPAGSPASDVPPGVGFAGFRVHDTGTPPGEVDDWLAFLGAAYFRSSGDLGQYGLSARGLALDTARPGGGPEEFPVFTEFFIGPMRGGAMTIHALLESPSATGAFRFRVTHYPHVVMDTEAQLFLRADVARFGVAPLTSMYWYSEVKRWIGRDWRPEVHDSDGLLVVQAAGERIWRALGNPAGVAVTPIPADGLQGFGLIQRDRAYAHYQDKAGFERRPSAFVETLEGFEKGRVDLVELPTGSEYNDNIVAFFVPEAPAQAGGRFAFRYRLHWHGAEPAGPLARLVDLRLGRSRLNVPPDAAPRRERKALLDFAGGPLAGLDPAAGEARVALSHGRAFRPLLTRSLDRADGWRLEIDLFTEEERPAEVAASIHVAGRPLAEEARFRFDPAID